MKTGREAVYRELRRLDQPTELAPQIVVAEYQAADLAQHETENKIGEHVGRVVMRIYIDQIKGAAASACKQGGEFHGRIAFALGDRDFGVALAREEHVSIEAAFDLRHSLLVGLSAFFPSIDGHE